MKHTIDTKEPRQRKEASVMKHGVDAKVMRGMSMGSSLRAVMALVSKDLRQWIRDPISIIAGLLAPLVMLLISATVFGIGGDAWPIGLTVDSHGPYSQRFVQMLKEAHSNITPYFTIVETDAAKSEQLAHTGRLFMWIHVPADFDAKIAQGQPATIETYQYNINTDMSKNTRLRLDNLLLHFRDSVAHDKTPLMVQYQTRMPLDIWRKTFIAGGAFTFALISCGLLYTSIAVATEWQKGTVKELLLSPSGQLVTVAGKILVSFVQTILTAALIFLLGAVFLGLRLEGDWLSTLLLILLTTLVFCCLGGLLGALLKTIRTVLPISIIVSIGAFFVTGGFSSVATLPAAARIIAPFIPTTYAFETMQGLFFHQPTPLFTAAVLIFLLLALLSGAGMLYCMKRYAGEWS